MKKKTKALLTGVLGLGLFISPSTHASSLPTPTTGGYKIETVRSNRQVVRAGMDVTLYSRFSQVGPGQCQIKNLTTGAVYNVSNDSGIIVNETSPGSYQFVAQVDNNGTITSGQSITVTWTNQANGTSNMYADASNHSANARYALSGGANASSLTVTEYIGNYGMGSSDFNAEVFGQTIGASSPWLDWTGLGIGTSASYSYTFSETGLNKVQMTGYALETNGNKAKAPASTFIYGGATSPYSSQLVNLGSNIVLSNLPTGAQVWWTPVGLTDKTRWQSQTIGSTATTFDIPANHMGAIMYNVNGGSNYYVDIQQ